MHATIVIMNGVPIRSSFFKTKEEAIAYAERMIGIVAVQEIGGDPTLTVIEDCPLAGIVWTRDFKEVSWEG